MLAVQWFYQKPKIKRHVLEKCAYFHNKVGLTQLHTFLFGNIQGEKTIIYSIFYPGGLLKFPHLKTNVTNLTVIFIKYAFMRIWQILWKMYIILAFISFIFIWKFELPSTQNSFVVVIILTWILVGDSNHIDSSSVCCVWCGSVQGCWQHRTELNIVGTYASVFCLLGPVLSVLRS